MHKLLPLAVMFLFQTGLRLGELCVLRYEDVCDDEIIVRRMINTEEEIIDGTKGSRGRKKMRARRVPLTDMAKALIELAYNKQIKLGIEPEYVFCTVDRPFLLYKAIQKAFYEYCGKLGILKRSPHKARKTFISELLESGVNPNTIKKIVGHSENSKIIYVNYLYDRKTKTEIFKQITSAIY